MHIFLIKKCISIRLQLMRVSSTLAVILFRMIMVVVVAVTRPPYVMWWCVNAKKVFPWHFCNAPLYEYVWEKSSWKSHGHIQEVFKAQVILGLLMAVLCSHWPLVFPHSIETAASAIWPSDSVSMRFLHTTSPDSASVKKKKAQLLLIHYLSRKYFSSGGRFLFHYSFAKMRSASG